MVVVAAQEKVLRSGPFDRLQSLSLALPSLDNQSDSISVMATPLDLATSTKVLPTNSPSSDVELAAD